MERSERQWRDYSSCRLEWESTEVKSEARMAYAYGYANGATHTRKKAVEMASRDCFGRTGKAVAASILAGKVQRAAKPRKRR